MVIHVGWSQSRTLSPGNDPMIIVGLHHQCPGDEHITQSNICQAAVDYAFENKKMKWDEFLKERKYDKIGDLTMNNFELKQMTFCEHQEAIRIATEIKLNLTYSIFNKTQHPPQWNKKNIKHWQHASRIILLIVHAPLGISKVLQAMFAGSDFAVWLIGNQQSIISALQGLNLFTKDEAFSINARNFLYLINNQTSTTSNNLHRPMSYNQAKDFIVIYLKTNSSSYQLHYDYFKQVLDESIQNLQLCPKVYNLDKSDSQNIQQLFQEVIPTNKSHVTLLVIGDPKHNWQFLRIDTNYYKEYHAKTNSSYLKAKQSIFFLDMKDQSTFQEQFFIESNLVQPYTFSKQEFSPETLNDVLHHIKHHNNRTKLNTAMRTIAYNCNNVFNNHLLKILQLIQIYKTINIFNSIDYSKFKAGIIKRTKSNNEDIRRLFVFLSSNCAITCFDKVFKALFCFWVAPNDSLESI